MFKRIALLTAGTTLLAGSAFADVPVPLNDTELDTLDAGFSIALGQALAGATAVGLVAYTNTATTTVQVAVPGLSQSVSGSAGAAVSFP